MKTMQEEDAKTAYVIDENSYEAPSKGKCLEEFKSNNVEPVPTPVEAHVIAVADSTEQQEIRPVWNIPASVKTLSSGNDPILRNLNTTSGKQSPNECIGEDTVDFITADHAETIGDSGMESAASSWDRTVAEAKEHAFTKLQEELKKAQEELKLRDIEVSRLSRIRSEVEAELEELTASLFQEAHNMVRAANIKQASAEKAFKESMMQIDVLTAEVSALKALVLTSTPSKPNPHLHPQLMDDSSGGIFKKHRRSPSHFNLKYGREGSPPNSPVKENKYSLDGDHKDVKDTALEVDPVVHAEFLEWKQEPTIDKTDPFIARIYKEDIDYCLTFANEDLSRLVRSAIETGDLFIEAVSDKAKTNFPKKCALLDAVRQCHYRLKVGNTNTWYFISHMCRNRIIAVCDFLNYLRYIQRGLVKSSAHDIYWEIVRLRKEMVLARLGLMLSS